MLYLIGIGLNEKSISLEGLDALKKCKDVYLDSYTSCLPYEIKKLEKVISKKIFLVDRNFLESNRLIEEARKKNVALLVYGDLFFATTHVSLLLNADKNRIKIKMIHSFSVFDAISETGLQSYKFGKISSIPKWEKNFEPCSFVDYIHENFLIKAHSLILIDPKLNFVESLNQLKIAMEKKLKINKDLKLVVCSKLTTPDSKIYYGFMEDLIKKSKEIEHPFCLIIPSELHFVEEEFLKKFEV